jgi:ribosome-binding ATPase YchF (GTP1/OBG family)
MMELELTLADLGVVEKRIERLEADVKKGRKGELQDLAVLTRAKDALSEGRPLREALTLEERDALRGYALLTAKPMLLAVNVGENDARALDLGVKPGLAVAYVSARIESEIAELSPEEAKAFREELGLSEGMVERVVRAAFDLMGVITFYTAGDTESRAWIVPARRGRSKPRAPSTATSSAASSAPRWSPRHPGGRAHGTPAATRAPELRAGLSHRRGGRGLLPVQRVMRPP